MTQPLSGTGAAEDALVNDQVAAGRLALAAMDRAAITKLAAAPDWRPKTYKRVDGGYLVTGCKTRLKKRGPHRGEPVHMTRVDRRTVLITTAEVDAARAAIASEGVDENLDSKNRSQAHVDQLNPLVP